MGFFGDVFDAGKGFLGKLNETLQDTGWAIGAPVATAVDIARAGFDHNPETTFGSALSTGINRGTQLLLGDQGDPSNPNDNTENLISPGVHKVMDGLEWLYDNAIAQPINTVNITEQRLLANMTGTEDNASPWDLASAWKRGDEKTGGYDGKGTSIGRESMYTAAGAFGAIPKLLGFGGDGVTGTLTDEGQRIVDEQSKTFDITSGTSDAAARWFLDPTIVGGKAAKALKFQVFLRSIKTPEALTKALSEEKAAGGLFSSFGDRLDQANRYNMGIDIGGPRSSLEIYAANPGMRSAGGDGWAMAQAMESASRDLWKANAPAHEIEAQGKLLALAGLGDPFALKGLDDKVAQAKDAIAAFRSQRDDLGKARDWAMFSNGPVAREAAQNVAKQFVDDVTSMGKDYLQSDEFLAMTNERLKAIQPQFRAAQQEAARTEKLRQTMEDVRGSLQDRPLLAGVRGGTGAMAKRAAKELERTQPARLDFVFQSSAWNKAVKLAVPASKVLTPHIYYGVKGYQKFRTEQAPRVIEMHDENAPLAVNNFLKHSAVAAEDRESIVSDMAAARTEGQKRAVVERAVTNAQASMIQKYMKSNPHFTLATAQTVIAEQARVIRQEAERAGLQTRKFTAHTKEDGSPGDAIIDPDSGHVIYRPLLETQLENRIVLPDLRQFTKILDRHSGWLSDMAEWSQGNRVPDPGRVKELGLKFFDKAVEMRPGLDVRTSRRADNLAFRKWQAGQYKDLALTGLTKAWKYSLLLRPAYPMRVLADSDMRALAVLGPAAFGMHFAPRAFGFLSMGSASRFKTHFAAHADDIELRGIKSDLEAFEDKWKADNEYPNETVDQFLERERQPDDGIWYSVTGGHQPKLTRINEDTKKRVETDLDHVYRVVSTDDYARMKANGYLDTRFDEHLDGAYDANVVDAAQKGMFAQATVDKMLLNTYGKAPRNVVMRINVKPGDGWVRDALDEDPWGRPLPILSNPGRLPFDRVSAVSPMFKGGSNKWLWEGEPEVFDLGPMTANVPITDEHYLGLQKKGQEIEQRLELYRNGGRKGRNEAYGRFGEVGQKDIETVAGKIKGAFADDYGRKQRYIISSKTTSGLMGDTQKLTLAHLMSENWTSLTAADTGHMDAWLHAVNAQLKQSIIGKKAIEFQAKNADDPERAVVALNNWIRNTPEGRAIKARMSWDTANGEAHAREIVGYVNHYLPTTELRQKALKDKITQQDLEALHPDPLDRPPVHGQALARAVGRGSVAGKAVNDWFARTMKWLSDAPEDQLARHPMYAAVYQQEAKRQAEWLMADPTRKDISLGEIQAKVQHMAHKKAQKAIKTYMFDTATQSDLSHALRFTSPFIAAWEDTIKKWGRIATDDPSIVGKGYLAWNAPADLGLVVDKDGHKVDEHDFNSESYMLMQWPSWVPKIGGKGVDLLPFVDISDETSFRIPMQSFNIILQGGLQPGFGPLVAIPVAKLQMAYPELNDVAQFVNPYGPPQSVWDAVAPSTAKRVAELVDGQSRSHMFDTQRIFEADLAEYRLDPEKFGNKPPTWESAAEKAKAVGILKIVNNFANPFPAMFDSKYKLYQDAYRDLLNKQRLDGHEQGWADDQFIKGYGEAFFPLVQSMSKNNGGVGPTTEGVNALKKYGSEVAKYGMEAGKPNSALIRMIVGDEGEGAYNQTAQRWQETREISPASGVNFRDVSKSQDAAANADADLGWYKYRQFQNMIDAQANDQGLRTAAESEELVAAKKEFVKNLGAELPAWRVDYESMDPGKFTRSLEALGQVATSDKFGVERTDMAGVRQYLVLREALQQQLAEAGISAGSQDALPLKQEFTNIVMDMVGSNTKFAEWAFHPFLENDPLLADLVPQSGQDPSVDTATQWGFN